MNPELTDRHRQIIELIAQGLTDVEVGKRLYISPDTAKSHLCTLLKRLDARNRTHAVTRGFQLGLLPLELEPDRSRAEKLTAEMDRLQQQLTEALVENAALRRGARLSEVAA